MLIRGQAAARPGRRRGFSLLELVLVLAIMATLAAVAIPRYSGSIARYRADVTARRIVADLALARARACSASKTVTAKFDISAGELWLSGIKGLNRPSSTYVVKLGEAPYRARLISADFAGRPEVNFNIYGMPDSAGQVVIAVGGSKRIIVLDAATGRAGVQ